MNRSQARHFALSAMSVVSFGLASRAAAAEPSPVALSPVVVELVQDAPTIDATDLRDAAARELGAPAQASRALCEQARTPAENARRTRARVLAIASRGKRRSRVAVLLVPIAAVLVGSSAWAGTHGGLSEMWSRVARLLMANVPDDRGTGAPREAFVVRPAAPIASVRPEPAAPIAAAPSIPELPVEALSPAIQVPLGSPSSGRKRADDPHDAKRAEVRPEEGAEDEEAARLYADAHRAHFVDRDPHAALRGWDAYLAASANGPLAPEARYNRALTLVRLDRLAEARAALVPFADGAYGGYRAQEARAILDALGQR